MKNTIPKADIYTRITNQIVADLEQGVRSWVKPWHSDHMDGKITRPLRHNSVPYTGINILSLWSSAMAQGFASPTWMTFRQAKELNASVRKGEKGSLVVYANKITRTDENENGEELERVIPFLKGYTVFNVEQIDGLPENYYEKPAPRFDAVERIGHAEVFFKNVGADIRESGNRAYYAVEPDYVRVPPIEAFINPESYYATLAHECTHWTRHPSRLDRSFGRKNWGDEGYAKEELVAELGAAFLCADLELTLEPRDDHASYIASWLKVLKDDTRAIFHAATHAQRAVDFLHSFQEETIGAA